MAEQHPRQPNTLGKASLILGILGTTFVFFIGLCAGLGHEQGWLPHVGGLLFVVGGTFAFLGLLSVILGFAGLFGRNRSRATAIVGLILGVVALFLFAAIVNAVN